MYSNDTIRTLEMSLGKMTAVEKSIADFFINNHEMLDFASRKIAKLLYVSEATLSRFAQKCGYSGYREFIFSYTRDLAEELKAPAAEEDISTITTKVKDTYSFLLQKCFSALNEDQIQAIDVTLSHAEKVYVFGVGSSGYAALEFQLRFMRLGMNVSAVTDTQMMRICASLADEHTLIFSLSLSGNQPDILDSIRIAKEKGAHTICLSATPSSALAQASDELVLVGAVADLDTGTLVSPQFSLLVVIDVLYAYYTASNSFSKFQKYHETLQAVKPDHGEDAT